LTPQLSNEQTQRKNIVQNEPLKFKTLILSDIHLGTKHCKAKEVLEVLARISYEKLILNGDIIDGWSLKRKGGWKETHSKVLNKIVALINCDSTEVVFTKGNHDEMLEDVLDFPVSKLNIVKEHIHQTEKGNYLITHGDRFDSVTQKHKWLAILGDIAYQLMMQINGIYNKYRSWRGKDYYSISKATKAFVKKIVSSKDDFNSQIVAAAKEANCVGVICGHIHTPKDSYIEDIHYLNSGDWVESLSAIVENPNGSFKVVYYDALSKCFN
jgi:UDP-2,3-diacylglucosamine pyrophosphatase LpxH